MAGAPGWILAHKKLLGRLLREGTSAVPLARPVTTPSPAVEIVHRVGYVDERSACIYRMESETLTPNTRTPTYFAKDSVVK